MNQATCDCVANWKWSCGDQKLRRSRDRRPAPVRGHVDSSLGLKVTENRPDPAGDGCGAAQVKDLETSIKKADVALVIIGTPIDLTRVLKITKPYQCVRYELQEIGQTTLEDFLKKKFGKKKESDWQAIIACDVTVNFIFQ